jgi:DNA polymerase-3 subunit epsilon
VSKVDYQQDQNPVSDPIPQSPIHWAFAAFEAGETFTAFDIETTGLDSRLNSIVEIGAVRFTKAGITGTYAALVNPGLSMPAGASSVNNITDEMLSGQPPIQETLPRFLDFIADTVLVAHNAPFDCGFINHNLSWLYDEGYAPFYALPNRIADTLPLSRCLLPGRKHYNLQDISADLGFKAEAAHRALDDARLCMEIFIYLADLLPNN